MSLLNSIRLKSLDVLIATLETVQKIRGSEKQPTIQYLQQIQEPREEIKFHADEDGILYLDNSTKISEQLNDLFCNFIVYSDTTKLLPGVIIYVVGKREPTEKRPWTVYKYEPRVITSIHDSGVNGGTVFFTYSHDIVKSQALGKSKDDFMVVSTEDAIYSPLTKGHAQFICAALNTQSRSLYYSKLAKIQQQNQQNQK